MAENEDNNEDITRIIFAVMGIVVLIALFVIFILKWKG